MRQEKTYNRLVVFALKCLLSKRGVSFVGQLLPFLTKAFGLFFLNSKSFLQANTIPAKQRFTALTQFHTEALYIL